MGPNCQMKFWSKDNLSLWEFIENVMHLNPTTQVSALHTLKLFNCMHHLFIDIKIISTEIRNIINVTQGVTSVKTYFWHKSWSPIICAKIIFTTICSSHPSRSLINLWSCNLWKYDTMLSSTKYTKNCTWRHHNLSSHSSLKKTFRILSIAACLWGTCQSYFKSTNGVLVTNYKS